VSNGSIAASARNSASALTACSVAANSNEGVEDDQTGIDLFDSIEEVWKVFWQGEGAEAAGIEFWSGFLYKGKEGNTGEVCTKGFEEWELGD
jgi:hypothetical protein